MSLQKFFDSSSGFPTLALDPVVISAYESVL